MKPDFSDIKLNSATKQTVAASENKDVWNTPEGIPVKKHFTKKDISEGRNESLFEIIKKGGIISKGELFSKFEALLTK